MPKLPVIKAKDLSTIPYHPSHEIRRGTLKGIINDLNISSTEFIEMVKEKV